jgi:hypothetical protein
MRSCASTKRQQFSQTGAVDGFYLTKLKHEQPHLRQKIGHRVRQRCDFLAINNTTFANHNCNIIARADF